MQKRFLMITFKILKKKNGPSTYDLKEQLKALSCKWLSTNLGHKRWVWQGEESQVQEITEKIAQLGLRAIIIDGRKVIL